MAENHHKYTGILLLIFALLILLGAIFFTISQVRVLNTEEYKDGNDKLQTAKNNLLVAYILGYVAAGISIVVSILYFGHVTWGIKSEIPHAVLFILLFLLVIVSGIFGFVALNNIDNSGSSDTKGSTGWIWAAEVAGLVAIILLIISGAWRAQYNSTKTDELADATKYQFSHDGTLNVPAPAVPSTQLTFTAPPQIYTSGGAPSYPAPAVGQSSVSV